MAKKHDLPLILHTRKAEARTFEILQVRGALGHADTWQPVKLTLDNNLVQEMEVKRADFHCYCGKVNLAKKVGQALTHVHRRP